MKFTLRDPFPKWKMGKMQKPPRWRPWISTAKSDIDSFFVGSYPILEPLSLKARLRERFHEEVENSEPCLWFLQRPISSKLCSLF